MILVVALMGAISMNRTVGEMADSPRCHETPVDMASINAINAGAYPSPGVLQEGAPPQLNSPLPSRAFKRSSIAVPVFISGTCAPRHSRATNVPKIAKAIAKAVLRTNARQCYVLRKEADL
jgi:hypothetical protein